MLYLFLLFSDDDGFLTRIAGTLLGLASSLSLEAGRSFDDVSRHWLLICRIVCFVVCSRWLIYLPRPGHFYRTSLIWLLLSTCRFIFPSSSPYTSLLRPVTLRGIWHADLFLFCSLSTTMYTTRGSGLRSSSSCFMSAMKCIVR